MPYLITNTTEWDNKDGKHIVHKAYYKFTSHMGIFSMNHMASKEEAKQYSTKALAKIAAQRLFRKFEIEKV